MSTQRLLCAIARGHCEWTQGLEIVGWPWVLSTAHMMRPCTTCHKYSHIPMCNHVGGTEGCVMGCGAGWCRVCVSAQRVVAQKHNDHEHHTIKWSSRDIVNKFIWERQSYPSNTSSSWNCYQIDLNQLIARQIVNQSFRHQWETRITNNIKHRLR